MMPWLAVKLVDKAKNDQLLLLHGDREERLAPNRSP